MLRDPQQVQDVPVLARNKPPESLVESMLNKAAPNKLDMRAALGRKGEGGAGMPGSLTWESMRVLFQLGKSIIGGPFAVTDVGARDGRVLMCAMFHGADNAHGPELEPYFCVDKPRRVGSVLGPSGKGEQSGFGPRFKAGRKMWAGFLSSIGIPVYHKSMHVDYGVDVSSYEALDKWPSPSMYESRNLPRLVVAFDAIFEDEERAVCYRLSSRDASVKVVMTTWKGQQSQDKALAELGPAFMHSKSVTVRMRGGEQKTMLVFTRT
jgi:hypothetical protein